MRREVGEPPGDESEKAVFWRQNGLHYLTRSPRASCPRSCWPASDASGSCSARFKTPSSPRSRDAIAPPRKWGLAMYYGLAAASHRRRGALTPTADQRAALCCGGAQRHGHRCAGLRHHQVPHRRPSRCCASWRASGLLPWRRDSAVRCRPGGDHPSIGDAQRLRARRANDRQGGLLDQRLAAVAVVAALSRCPRWPCRPTAAGVVPRDRLDDGGGLHAHLPRTGAGRRRRQRRLPPSLWPRVPGRAGRLVSALRRHADQPNVPSVCCSQLGIVAGIWVIARGWGRLSAATLCAAFSVVFVVHPDRPAGPGLERRPSPSVCGASFLAARASQRAPSRVLRCSSAVVLAGLALTFRPDLGLALALAHVMLLWRRPRPMLRFAARGRRLA